MTRSTREECHLYQCGPTSADKGSVMTDKMPQKHGSELPSQSSSCCKASAGNNWREGLCRLLTAAPLHLPSQEWCHGWQQQHLVEHAA